MNQPEQPLGNCACFLGSARKNLTDPQRKRTVGKSWRNQLHKTVQLTTENKRNETATAARLYVGPHKHPHLQAGYQQLLQSLGVLNVELEFFNLHAGKIQLGL